MKSLLALDLSRNNLSRLIPSSMSMMTLLSYLDVSYNNLSGRIPSSTQLQSFEPSEYIGNTRLCGPPITQNCPKDKAQEVPHAIFEDAGAVDDMDGSWRWFSFGASTGFATGFWVACSALLLNRRGRHAFFRFHDRMKDWIYLRMVLLRDKLQRATTTRILSWFLGLYNRKPWVAVSFGSQQVTLLPYSYNGRCNRKNWHQHHGRQFSHVLFRAREETLLSKSYKGKICAVSVSRPNL